MIDDNRHNPHPLGQGRGSTTPIAFHLTEVYMLYVFNTPDLRRAIVKFARWSVLRDWFSNALTIRKGTARQWNAGALAETRNQKLETLFKRAVSGSHYYHRLISTESFRPAEDPLERLRDLPSLASATLFEAANELVDTSYLETTAKRAFVTRSSGTSGPTKAVFHFEDANYVPSAIALTRLFSCWLGRLPTVIAWLDLPTGQPFIAYHSGFHLFLNVTADHLVERPEIIRERRIEVLVGNPFELKRVATALRDRAVPVDFKLVVSMYDLLDGRTRSFVADTLQCPVADAYAMSELSAMVAFQCSRSAGLHVNTDQIHVEILDLQSDAPAAPGKVGEVVVTDLNNQLMPLIRYRTGDVARMIVKPCPCGRATPLITQLEGRVGASITVESSQLFARDVFRATHHLDLGLGEIAIVATPDLSLLDVRYAPKSGAEQSITDSDVADALRLLDLYPTVIRRVHSVTALRMAKHPTITVRPDYGPTLDRTRGGERR